MMLVRYSNPRDTIDVMLSKYPRVHLIKMIEEVLKTTKHKDFWYSCLELISDSNY